MFTVADLAKRWGCGNKAVLDLIHTGKLAAWRSGHAYRVGSVALEAFERDHRPPRRAQHATPEQRDIPRGVSARHEAARPAGARSRGLRYAIVDRAGFDPGELGFWPDDYEVDAATSTITLCEVVVTHDISAGKLKKIGRLCDAAESNGWRVRLRVAGPDARYADRDPRTGRMAEHELAAAIALLETPRTT